MVVDVGTSILLSLCAAFAFAFAFCDREQGKVEREHEREDAGRREQERALRIAPACHQHRPARVSHACRNTYIHTYTQDVAAPARASTSAFGWSMGWVGWVWYERIASNTIVTFGHSRTTRLPAPPTGLVHDVGPSLALVDHHLP